MTFWFIEANSRLNLTLNFDRDTFKLIIEKNTFKWIFREFLIQDAEAYNFSPTIWELTFTKSIELHNKLFA